MEGGLPSLRSKNSYINISFYTVNYTCRPVTARECNKMANGALCAAIHRKHHRAQFFDLSCGSHGTHKKSKFIYIHNKSPAFPAPIFTKLTTAKQYYVHISCTEFNCNRTLNAEIRSSRISSSFSMLNTAFSASIFGAHTAS
jgi:hypothetical protein